MLALTKRPHTKGFIEFRVLVPEEKEQRVEEAINEALEPSYTIAEAFPNMIPGDVLAGIRATEGLSQARLAAKLGIHKSNISEMERGKRSISVDMAKRLGEVLNVNYKVFL